MDLAVALVPLQTAGPDPTAMARQLEGVLGLTDAMHLHPPERRFGSRCWLAGDEHPLMTDAQDASRRLDLLKDHL